MSFEATLPKEATPALAKFLTGANYKLEEKRADNALRSQLQAKRAAIEAKDPQYFAKLDEHVKELIAAAQTAVKAEMDAKFAVDFEKKMAELKADLERDTPSILFTADYRYQAAKRDVGDPGWSRTPAMSVKAGKQCKCEGVVDLDKVYTLDVPGAQVSLPVKVHAAFSVGTDYAVWSGNIEDLSMPDSAVSALPRMEIKGSIAITSPDQSIGGNGNLTGLNCHGNYDLVRAKGTIHADPKTAGSP